MEPSILVVGTSYAIHLVATVIWFGWSVLLIVAGVPDTDDVTPRATALQALVRRTMPLALLAFATLAVTGLYQMVTDTHYEDFLQITSSWSRLLLFKHLAFALDAIVLLWLRLIILPELGYQLRAARARRGQHAAGEVSLLQRRYRLAAWVNLFLGLGILVVTGFITGLP